MLRSRGGGGSVIEGKKWTWFLHDGNTSDCFPIKYKKIQICVCVCALFSCSVSFLHFSHILSLSFLRNLVGILFWNGWSLHGMFLPWSLILTCVQEAERRNPSLSSWICRTMRRRNQAMFQVNAACTTCMHTCQQFRALHRQRHQASRPSFQGNNHLQSQALK